jgi:hypothetical protein
MRIESTHRKIVLVVTIACAAACIYVWCGGPATDAIRGQSGGSGLRLLFGIVGATLIWAAGVKGFRKLLRAWPLGNARIWMMGHLWLGALSLPAIWLHGGFAHGGELTSILMWMLYIVIISGVCGAVLQHMLPRQMSARRGYEVTYEEIPQALGLLQSRAELVVRCTCGPDNGDDLTTWRDLQRMDVNKQLEGRAIEVSDAEQMMASIAAAPAAGATMLRQFYDVQLA